MFPEARDDGQCGGCRPDPAEFYLDARISVSVYYEDTWELEPSHFKTPEEWQRAVDLVKDVDLRRENHGEWLTLKNTLKRNDADLDWDGDWDFQVREPKPRVAAVA